MSNTSAAPVAKSPINPQSAGTPTETLVRNALEAAGVMLIQTFSVYGFGRGNRMCL